MWPIHVRCDAGPVLGNGVMVNVALVQEVTE